MTDVPSHSPARAPGALIRAYRSAAGELSLDDLADRLHQTGCDRPSIAKLSRIENGLQPVPIDLLEPLRRVAQIPARFLRPDLAKLFVSPRGRQRTRAAA